MKNSARIHGTKGYYDSTDLDKKLRIQTLSLKPGSVSHPPPKESNTPTSDSKEHSLIKTRRVISKYNSINHRERASDSTLCPPPMIQVSINSVRKHKDESDEQSLRDKSGNENSTYNKLIKFSEREETNNTFDSTHRDTTRRPLTGKSASINYKSSFRLASNLIEKPVLFHSPTQIKVELTNAQKKVDSIATQTTPLPEEEDPLEIITHFKGPRSRSSSPITKDGKNHKELIIQLKNPLIQRTQKATVIKRYHPRLELNMTEVLKEQLDYSESDSDCSDNSIINCNSEYLDKAREVEESPTKNHSFLLKHINEASTTNLDAKPKRVSSLQTAAFNRFHNPDNQKPVNYNWNFNMSKHKPHTHSEATTPKKPLVLHNLLLNNVDLESDEKTARYKETKQLRMDGIFLEDVSKSNQNTPKARNTSSNIMTKNDFFNNTTKNCFYTPKNSSQSENRQCVRITQAKFPTLLLSTTRTVTINDINTTYQELFTPARKNSNKKVTKNMNKTTYIRNSKFLNGEGTQSKSPLRRTDTRSDKNLNLTQQLTISKKFYAMEEGETINLNSSSSQLTPTLMKSKHFRGLTFIREKTKPADKKEVKTNSLFRE